MADALKPLCGLAGLLEAPATGRVLIVEGELMRDALAEYLKDTTVLTWRGAIYEVALTDWSPLAYREVEVCLSEDPQGSEACDTLAPILRSIGAQIRYREYASHISEFWTLAIDRYTCKAKVAHVRDVLIEALNIYANRHSLEYKIRVANILKLLGFVCRVEKPTHYSKARRVYRRSRAGVIQRLVRLSELSS